MRRWRAVFRLVRRYRRGQATIEYMLMLGSILVVFSAFLTAFHNDIARWFFMFVGQMLTK
ncbi:MAG: hypothetical protein IJ311_04555 [Elusimicrobiaceae bacterium]|nr:hypothetical protein [Elusimicrobiaceae bacterium]